MSSADFRDEAPPASGYIEYLVSCLPFRRVLLIAALILVLSGDGQFSDTLKVCHFALAAVCVICATYLKAVWIKKGE